MNSKLSGYKWSSSNERHSSEPYQVLEEFEPNGNEVTSFFRVLQGNRTAYLFLCVMGLVPTNDEYVNKGIPRIVLSAWNVLLVISLMLSFITELVIAFGSSLNHEALNGRYGVDAFVIVFFLLFQFVTIIYTVMKLKEEIVKERIIDVKALNAQIQYSLKMSCRALVAITLCTLLSFFFYLAYCLTKEADSHSARVGYVVVPTAMQPILLIGSNLYLVGILFIVTVEERMTLFSIQQLIDKTKDRTITHKVYVAAQRDILTREEKLPINLLSITALLNSLFGIIIYILFAYMDKHSGPLFAVYAVFVELAGFGRELLFLCLVLYEIVTVNEQARILVQTLSEEEWDDCDGEKGDGKPAVSDKTRQSVLLAALGKPIGASIFGKQLTVGMVLFRLASTIAVTVLATESLFYGCLSRRKADLFNLHLTLRPGYL